MTIKIKIGDDTKTESKPTQATISLKVSKTLDGNLLINDHKHVDIVVVPKDNKIITMPKPYAEIDTFQTQKEFFYSLFKGGVTEGFEVEGGVTFGTMEAKYPAEADVDPLQAVLLQIERYIKETSDDEAVFDNYDANIEDNFIDPDAQKSTEAGEVPPYEDTPEGSQTPTYSYYGYGYRY